MIVYGTVDIINLFMRKNNKYFYFYFINPHEKINNFIETNPTKNQLKTFLKDGNGKFVVQHRSNGLNYAYNKKQIKYMLNIILLNGKY